MSLLRRFTAMGLVVVAALGLAIGLVLKHQIEQRALAHAVQNTRVIAEVDVQSQLGPADLRYPIPLERLGEIDREIGARFFDENGILTVKLARSTARSAPASSTRTASSPCHSSLSYLKRLPLDEVKIDRSFVAAMADDENDAVIVRSTIDLARNLGLRVVAEGAETAEIMETLTDLRCDVAQGYHISRPMPADELDFEALARAAHADRLRR